MTTSKIVAPKKLIEVALPLDDINKAAAREKSIRHGHPSTLHLWWARRPLAAARAVLFAQLVNDPSWKYSEEELKKPQVKSAITRKRNELFRIISDLVQWENTTKEDVLSRARAEIRASWQETCEANQYHPDAKRLFEYTRLPAFHDPFAGGGAIPLEAQRLGLEAHATDLNPVAVLINKALIEIPPRLAGYIPIGPIPKADTQTATKQSEDWAGAKGLAEDVQRYGTWMRSEAYKQVGHLYPEILVTKAIVKQRPDLAAYEGRRLTVIAWIWARTVISPNPAARGRRTPLTTTYMLSTKEDRQAWIECRPGETNEYKVCVGSVRPTELNGLRRGTRAGKAQDFVCIHTESPVTRSYIRSEGKAGRLGQELLALVLAGDNERLYVSPVANAVPSLSRSELAIVSDARTTFLSGDTPTRAMTTGGVCSAYGLQSWGRLYTDRQVLVLTTLADIVPAVRARVLEDATRNRSGFAPDLVADALATIVALAISKIANLGSTLTTWMNDRGAFRETFARQALPMTWDFAEANPFSEAGGSLDTIFGKIEQAIAMAPAASPAEVRQQTAQSATYAQGIVSTDPPYYDNIAYADLSDFFYPWLRRALAGIHKELFATLVTPKQDELVATPHRHGSQGAAEAFFLAGMTEVMHKMADGTHPAFPVTVYYAFKQADTGVEGTASTGWVTFLDACLRAGFAIVGTWPMRTEGSGRLVALGTNALASSIVLVLRRRANEAPISRREFLRELDRVLPSALVEMTVDPTAAVAPVDLAQASIGPGMAVFSRYRVVLEADGSAMTVQNALMHINKAIDEYFAHAEGDLDADTRFCIGWFEQYGFEPGEFGKADVLSRAKGTSVDGLKLAGVIEAGKGKVRLLTIKDLPKKWDPSTDIRTPIWEALHHMCKAFAESEGDAGVLLARMPQKQDAIRQLAYRLYTLCAERKKQAELGRPYNDLITSWPAIVEASQKAPPVNKQLGLL
jgi:putative DNA methylase